jgi:hypothetical protein
MDALANPFKEQQDIAEAIVASLPQVELPLEHFFTKGLYVRKIFMPAGSVVCSRTHLTQHPWFLLQGAVSVVDEYGYRKTFKAPYIGITEPGARRTILVMEDCVWATAHVTDLTDPDEIAEAITSGENDKLPDGFVHACFERKGREICDS